MRYWTEEEARDYLPRAKALVAVIRRAARVEIRARGNGHGSLAGSSAGAGSETPAEPDTAGAAAPGVDAESARRELDAQGIIVRDPRRGLIDFPSRHPSGRDVLLCWQVGEDDLAWWHLPEDGFAGRGRSRSHPSSDPTHCARHHSAPNPASAAPDPALALGLDR